MHIVVSKIDVNETLSRMGEEVEIMLIEIK